jgi:hypothetical protein
METTFQEVCQRLGFETKEALVRDSDPEGRSCTVGPVLCGYTIRSPTHGEKSTGSVRQTAWYYKSHPTFSDALALVCRQLWAQSTFLQVAFSDRHSKSPAGVPRAANRRSLLCGLNGQSPAEGTFSEVRIH